MPTAINALPYPSLTAPTPPDVPADLQALAEAIDGKLVAAFATATARDAAIPSPTDGMVCYLVDVDQYRGRINGAWEWVAAPTGTILTGTTGARPASPSSTVLYWNTTTASLQVYSGGWGEAASAPYPGVSLYPHSTNAFLANVHGTTGQALAMSHPALRTGTLVASVADTNLVYSTDSGVTWTNTSSFPATTKPWSGLSVIGSVLVAVQRGTNYGNAASTPTATPGTWTARAMPASGFWQDTASNGTVCVAVGQSTTGTATTQAASTTDGTTWTSRTIQSGIWDSVCWDGTKFIACEIGGSGKVSVSTDGVTWSAATVATGAGNNGSHVVSDGAGLAAFVGSGGVVFYTTDQAASWNSMILPAQAGTVDTYQLYYANGHWFAFGYVSAGTSTTNTVMHVWSTADLTAGLRPTVLPSPQPIQNQAAYSRNTVNWVVYNGAHTLFGLTSGVLRAP